MILYQLSKREYFRVTSTRRVNVPSIPAEPNVKTRTLCKSRKECGTQNHCVRDTVGHPPENNGRERPVSPRRAVPYEPIKSWSGASGGAFDF
jgi:hypothetical protein